MPFQRPSFVFISILVLTCWLSRGATFAATSKDEAALALSNGEDTVNSAFHAVLEAEQAGANVSHLLTSLNSAEQLFTQARISFSCGDFENASRFADLGKELGEAVKVEASGLRNSTLREWRERFLIAIVESIFLIGLVVSGSFISWRLFKRRYYRRVLGMKPGVLSDEA